MGLGGFGSLFELFVVFNFVYYGADEFRLTLSKTIFRGRKYLERIFSSSDSIYDLLLPEEEEAKLGDTLKLFNDADSKEWIEEVKKSKSRYEVEKNQILDKFSDNCVINGFSKYCLLAALYGLVILLLSGLMPALKYEKFVYDYLLFASSLILVCLLAFLLNDHFQKYDGEIRSLFIIILFFSLGLGGVYSYLSGLTLINKAFTFSTKSSAIYLSIGVVSSHFLLYSFRYLYIYHFSKKKAKELNEDIKEELSEITPGLITTSIDTIEMLDNASIESPNNE